MRKLLLVPLLLMALVLTGCDGYVFLRLDMPVVIEPQPSPQYRHYVEGYVSYDYRTNHITITRRPNRDKYYLPLKEAQVMVLETGKRIVTDHQGYFYISGVPRGTVNLKVTHNWIGPRTGVYFRYTSK